MNGGFVWDSLGGGYGRFQFVIIQTDQFKRRCSHEDWFQGSFRAVISLLPASVTTFGVIPFQKDVVYGIERNIFKFRRIHYMSL